jgi:outer membrane protein assembly factor BamD (BamD/ComL family)
MRFETGLRAFFCAVLTMAALAAAIPAPAAEGVRPEVGNPLKAAATALRARQARQALAEVAKAEAVPNRTAYENFLIHQMKGSAANAAGDYDTAIASFESVLQSGRVSGRESSDMVKAIAVAYYQKKDYAKASQWTQRYFKEGGSDPAMRTMLLQSHYLSGDCNAVSRAANDEARASEEELQMLLSCYTRGRDSAGEVATLEKLVVRYPKKDYWANLLARVQKKPGFSDRLALHVYRLKLATGNMKDGNDYMEMAQLALQAGSSAEAKQVVDKGFETKALGTGKDAERHARLKALVDKSIAASAQTRAKDEAEAMAAPSGEELVKLGMNYAYEGKADKGVPLIEQGIKKGNLKRPEDAKLTLGEAQLLAGHKQRAVQTLRGVSGNDGTADIARLWVLNART